MPNVNTTNTSISLTDDVFARAKERAKRHHPKGNFSAYVEWLIVEDLKKEAQDAAIHSESSKRTPPIKPKILSKRERQ